MSSDVPDYPSANAAVNELLRQLVATDAKVMLDDALHMERRGDEDSLELARHIIRLHTGYQVQNALFRVKYPNAGAE